VGTETTGDQRAGGRAPALLRPLLPPGAPATAAEIVEHLGLWERAAGLPGGARPRVMLNMVSTADGRATLGGRSGPISGPADRELFHALRAPVDAVLVGAGTIRAERYGRLIPDPARRALRLERGLPEEPLACIVTGSLGLDTDTPLLAEPAARVLLLTPSEAELGPTGARLDYVRAAREGALDLAGALVELAMRHGVESLLCEGGPALAGELLAAGLVDELFLSVSPKLAGGDPPGGPAPRIVSGAELEPAAELELRGVLESDSHLFLRYSVVAPERVSRETMPSSSVAR